MLLKVGEYEKNLNKKRASADNLNRLIGKAILSMNTILRFEGQTNVDLNDFETNSVPFPRLYFMTTLMAPVLTPEKAETDKNDAGSPNKTCFVPARFLVKFSRLNISKDWWLRV